MHDLHQIVLTLRIHFIQVFNKLTPEQEREKVITHIIHGTYGAESASGISVRLKGVVGGSSVSQVPELS